MTDGWAYGGAPPAPHPATVTLVDGPCFCLSDDNADIGTAGEQGLFYRDTRFLSRFSLLVDGQPVPALTHHIDEPYTALFIGRRPPRPGTADSTLLVTRRRLVGNGLLERLTLRNLSREAAAVTVQLAVDSDFAGLFDVKEGRARSRTGIRRDARGGSLRFAVTTRYGSRAVTVTGSDDPIAVDDTLEWRLTIPSRDGRELTVAVVPNIDGTDVPARHRSDQPVADSAPAEELSAWRRIVPAVTSGDERLARTLARSADDLGVLRVRDPAHPHRAVVAAGAPWFMTLFGRDSLLTSWMLLPIDPTLALGTLKTLAELQGRVVNPLTEEEPGRILHEVRTGLDAEASLGGSQVYYGSVDATPLFVTLLGELRRWGLARREVDDLLPSADRALDWILRYGDRDGDGFVEYQRATDAGLVNQGWKDSFDAISFASGTLAEPPIALAEVQGYTYAAFLARAHFARETGDLDVAERWATRARQLKRRFNEAFWLPDRGYYALALDADKRPVDALASNMGHCLFTGIVDEDKAPAVAAALTSTEMFTGFGVRTLAASMGAYNPVSYHNGSVWPHDNAIVALGLARYGCNDAAQRITLGMLDAAEAFGYRLPELFSGFDRREFDFPVPYPTSCSPQAWAAGAPFFLLRALLHLDPWVPFGRVWCDPQLPARLLPLRVDRLHLAGRPVTIEISEAGWTLRGLPDGLQLIRAPRRPLTATTPPALTDDDAATLTSL